MSRNNNVECVVLAGGFGTRLSPLTDSKPKPLVKILDNAVLELAIQKVKRTSVQSIAVSTFYKSDMIEKTCGLIDKNIKCKREKHPLGTAGGVKNCISGNSDAVLVVSGDAVFDFDLQPVIDFHFENENDVTVVTFRKENPTEYGVVITDEQNNIIRFDEKPAWKNVRSDLVNTGIYVLSRNAIDRIPENIQYDFSKNLFPKFVRESGRIKSFCAEGGWCDIGTLDEYYNCNRLAAGGNGFMTAEERVSVSGLNRLGIHAEKDVYVSRTAHIGRNVRIGRGSVVCKGAVISDDCDIEGCIIGQGTFVGKGSSFDCAIIGEKVSVGENCVFPEGCVVGDGCRIPDGTVLRKNTRVTVGTDLHRKGKTDMDFSGNTMVFKDDGVAVFEGEKSLSELLNFAGALSIAFRKSNERFASIAVMCKKGTEHLKSTFCAGLLTTGTVVFDCKEGNETLCSFAAKKLETDAAVFISHNETDITVTVFSEQGSVIDNEIERKITKIYSSFCNDTQSVECNASCSRTVSADVSELYANSLIKYTEKVLSGTSLDGMKISMLRDELSNNLSSGVLKRVLESQSCIVTNAGTRDMINVSISEDGKRVKIRCSNIVLDHEHACAVVLKNAQKYGFENIFAGESSPDVLKNMVKDEQLQDKGMFCITEDAAACAAVLVAIVRLSAEGVEKLFSDIPQFEIFTDEYIADINRGATVERLVKMYNDTKNYSGDGIHLTLSEGSVTVIPNRARGFKIISEAHSMEAAKELSVKIGRAIKNEE